MNTLENIYANKIIAILRGLSQEQAERVVDALVEGGLRLVEVTFNQTKDPVETAETIYQLSKRFGEQVAFGAGTVMTTQQLHAAYQAGAKYIIAPNCDSTIIKETKDLGLVSMPGAFTATEIVQAYNAGADIVKVFPSDSVDPGYFSALHGPLSHIPLAAVGGVNLNNIQNFFDAGVCCVGIGSNIADKVAIARGDYTVLTALARAYIQRLL